MTESDGVVVRLEGEFAWVRAAGAGSACGACAHKDGCNSSATGTLLDGALSHPARLLRLKNTIQACPGEAVVICVADGVVLRAIWMAYGVPLLLALAGAMVAIALTGSEVLAVAGMLSGLFGGYFLLHQRRVDPDRAEPILSINFKRSPLSFHEV